MEEYSPESTAIFQNINLDYNAITGGLVYDKLVSVSHTYSEELQKFLKGLDKDVFIADFVNYEKVLNLMKKMVLMMMMMMIWTLMKKTRK